MRRGLNIVTVRYDACGNLIWARSLDNGATDYGQGVTVDNDGNVITTGYSYSGSNTRFATVKYDASGTQLWKRDYDWGGGDSKARSVAVDGAGSVYVAGEAGNDFAVLKYDPSGNLSWSKRYGAGYTDRAFAITVDSTGEVWVAGDTFDGISDRDFLIFRLDSDGNELWQKTYDSGIQDEAHALAVGSA